MAEKRFGGIPPIVTVLITISAVVAAGIVAWFLFSTTSSATKAPILEVTSAYALCPSATSCNVVFITLRNVGAVDATITGARLELAVAGASSQTCTTGTVPAGGSINMRCPASGTANYGNIPDGASAVLAVNATITGGTGTYSMSIGFKVARP